MKNFSSEIGGVFVAIGGIILVQYGFSEGCSGEIIGKVGPLLGALPGLAVTYFARLRKGDVNPLGKRK